VEIRELTVDPGAASLDITYRNDESARLELSVNRDQAVVAVSVNYDTGKPFATFRSMYVSDENADADRVRTIDGDSPFLSGSAIGWSVLRGPWWFFYRAVWSRHNSSAPDILIEAEDVPIGTASATVCVNHCWSVYLPIVIE